MARPLAGRLGLGPVRKLELLHNIAEAAPEDMPEEEPLAEDEERTSHATKEEGQEGRGQVAEHWVPAQGISSADRGHFG